MDVYDIDVCQYNFKILMLNDLYIKRMYRETADFLI